MSSAQDASIFQSALLAPFPRLTSIAAVVLTLLTAPVANASVIAAVKNAQGNDVMLFELLAGAESGTGEDVSAADQGALLEAGAWLGGSRSDGHCCSRSFRYVRLRRCLV